MPTPEEITKAVKIVGDFAGNPDTGVVAELLRDLANSSKTPSPEVRVVEVKETR